MATVAFLALPGLRDPEPDRRMVGSERAERLP